MPDMNNQQPKEFLVSYALSEQITQGRRSDSLMNIVRVELENLKKTRDN